MKKFYIYSLGCKVNSYEIEAIKDELLNAGLEISDENEADYIIINTCCVTNNAASKSRQKIHSFHLKNKAAKIIVMGCYVQGFEDEVKGIDGISLLVGTNNRSKIKDYIINDENNKISLVGDIKDFTKYEELSITSYFENTRAYLKIQDGCNNFCSYCIIPYVRGVIKSRNKDEVINEAKHLIKMGYKEIVLTGIHTGSYGKDLSNYTFSNLVRDLLALDGLYRLRISSIEESEIDDDLINMLINDDKLAKHLHIPLQAGSDHILKLMNRKYDLQTYINNVKNIQNKVKDIAISTDIIVGFPNETEEDFMETIKTSKEIGYSKIHVFPFSSRKGTVASKMKNQINGNIKKERCNELISLSNKLGYEYNKKFLNKVVSVLIEEKENDYYVGHTTNFIKVKIESIQNIERNSIINVVIKEVYDSYVIGNMEE
ncbi:MAG: tRNA (N(6)-L-threonylcarbamoyladenosine(37)-C(2))-methylthiotransferase MtaB [Candidatus Caccosoma sp.]|nr:tRNA (N(6)-L-threonylcarbamoyladenosine(37)-C(2))-methylthiotransferase MtaB [Candidatus Caccosoma sp.]